jgi:two-component system sensor histidine kinase KdpD
MRVTGRVEQFLQSSPNPSWVRAGAIGVSAALLATLVALPFARTGVEAAIPFYLLAVVVASTGGGLRSGLVAAVVSSIGITFIFAPPRFQLHVDRVEDVLSSGVFIVVAIVVGLLVARSADMRERATHRERDARLLGYLATKLLSGERLENVLHDVAAALLEPFDLTACRIFATLDGHEIRSEAVRSGPTLEAGAFGEAPIMIGGVTLGVVTAVRSVGMRPFSSSDRDLLEAAARQIALAVERARLDARVRGVQLEAETNELRAALFSSVTHDLRTPLASIKAGVTSLLTGTVHDAEQQRELLTTVLEETDRLNRVVGNLMDLARVRAGALVPAREATDIEEVVLAVVARMQPQLTGVVIRLRLRPSLPEVFVDPVQLDQVLTNVIENASLHSPPGGEVTLSAASYRDAVEIRIADQGPGISPADRQRVFEAFYRGGAEPERPGTGLGLAIAQAIVVANGGRIWIDGAPGGGAVVAFELPVAGERSA